MLDLIHLAGHAVNWLWNPPPKKSNTSQRRSTSQQDLWTRSSPPSAVDEATSPTLDTGSASSSSSGSWISAVSDQYPPRSPEFLTVVNPDQFRQAARKYDSFAWRPGTHNEGRRRVDWRGRTPSPSTSPHNGIWQRRQVRGRAYASRSSSPFYSPSPSGQLWADSRSTAGGPFSHRSDLSSSYGFQAFDFEKKLLERRESLPGPGVSEIDLLDDGWRSNMSRDRTLPVDQVDYVGPPELRKILEKIERRNSQPETRKEVDQESKRQIEVLERQVRIEKEIEEMEASNKQMEKLDQEYFEKHGRWPPGSEFYQDLNDALNVTEDGTPVSPGKRSPYRNLFGTLVNPTQPRKYNGFGLLNFDYGKNKDAEQTLTPMDIDRPSPLVHNTPQGSRESTTKPHTFETPYSGSDSSPSASSNEKKKLQSRPRDHQNYDECALKKVIWELSQPTACRKHHPAKQQDERHSLHETASQVPPESGLSFASSLLPQQRTRAEQLFIWLFLQLYHITQLVSDLQLPRTLDQLTNYLPSINSSTTGRPNRFYKSAHNPNVGLAINLVYWTGLTWLLVGVYSARQEWLDSNGVGLAKGMHLVRERRNAAMGGGWEWMGMSLGGC